MIGNVITKEYLDLDGLAEYASLSVKTLRGHIRAHGLTAYRVDGKILVKRSDFDAWIGGYRMKPEIDIKKIVKDLIG
jgi:excisionase family DNA binding protein